MSNRLAAESSPYLRQHADNPVDWYPWGDAAFAAATARDVPVLLSVGYSACHWCHVMAHQSFEDEEVGAAMNAAFVNIKVDREERPDVDAVYMEAVQAMTGRGGWPMTVLMTPDGDPFFAGTYLPRDGFLRLIAAAVEAWGQRRAELTAKTGELREILSRTARLRPADSLPTKEHLDAAVAALRQHFDPSWGGFGPAPKFPSTSNLDLLLAADAVAPAAFTLDAMAAGGMYDHLGGGFARYSVDERWLVPHFEKMLYDQALLLRTYARAASSAGEHPSADHWRRVAGSIVDFLGAELLLPDGGFASALDADSPGPDGTNGEGWYYTWTPAEVTSVLGDDELAATACAYWDITDEGNFESRSIPNRLGRPLEPLPAQLAAARHTLAAARRHRPPPGRDDKVITEWNALAIAALAEAGAALAEPGWIDLAVGAAEFLLDQLRHGDEGGRHWSRVWHVDGDPPARHDALAADYAALVDAFTRLAEATGEARWIELATESADTLLATFWDVDRGGLLTRPDRGDQLIARQKELFDNATPSANGHAALALYRLAALTDEQRYANHADRILALVAAVVAQAPTAFGTSLLATLVRSRGTTEVVVAGDRADLVSAAATAPWTPERVIAWGERYDSPLWAGRADGSAYVCKQYACQLPATDAATLVAQLTADR